jgi:hypothetical protein
MACFAVVPGQCESPEWDKTTEVLLDDGTEGPMMISWVQKLRLQNLM